MIRSVYIITIYAKLLTYKDETLYPITLVALNVYTLNPVMIQSVHSIVIQICLKKEKRIRQPQTIYSFFGPTVKPPRVETHLNPI